MTQQWYIKCLRPNAESPYQRGHYWHQGQWVRSFLPVLKMCGSGLHLCRYQDTPFWVREELWWTEVNPYAEVLTEPGENKFVVSCARIVEKIPNKHWNKKVMVDIMDDLGFMSSLHSVRRLNFDDALDVFRRSMANSRRRYPRRYPMGGHTIPQIADAFWRHVNP